MELAEGGVHRTAIQGCGWSEGYVCGLRLRSRRLCEQQCLNLWWTGPKWQKGKGATLIVRSAVRARYSRPDYQEPSQSEAGVLHAGRKERATKSVSGHGALGEARA
jgi:hypothetical protein